MKKFILKRFSVEGCLSYMLYDPVSKECAVIDPSVDLIEDYVDYVHQHKLKPIIALDTHIHADHFSATHFFRSKYGTEVGMSAKTSSQRATKKLTGGDKIFVDSFELDVLETPGHTSDSLSFVCKNLIFTGDALFAGSSGRTDFPGADPAMQWDSIHNVIGKLPGDSIILPGHDYNGFIFTTLQTEREKNPHWMPDSKDRFIALKKSELIATSSDDIKKRVEFNRALSPTETPTTQGCATACGVPVKDAGTFENIDAKKYEKQLNEIRQQSVFIDVREPEEFKLGHIPGTKNIPLSELPLNMTELPKEKTIYVSCLGGGRSSMAAKTLNYLGYPHVVNLSGGFKGWASSGLPIEK